jgi:hypothetical protein
MSLWEDEDGKMALCNKKGVVDQREDPIRNILE